MKKVILLTLLTLLSTQTFSQSIRLADKHYKHFAYPKAVKLYEAIYAKDSSQYVLKQIADCYYKNAETKKSEYWYSKLVDTYGEKVSQESLFNYAQSLRSNGNYEKSDLILSKLDRKHLANIKVDTRNLLNEDRYKDKVISIRNLAINTEFSDFGGFVHNNEFYFASSRPIKLGRNRIYDWNNQPFLNLYKSLPEEEEIEKEDGKRVRVLKVDNKKLLGKPINTRYHESNAVFTKDGNTMYFTRVNSLNGRRAVKDKKNIVNLKLYKATLKDDKWTNITELPFNSDDYSVGHPALSPDEKTLYFTSDMPGGYGLGDIYKVDILEEGYGTPVNLGSEINTSGKEMFPYVSNDNKLYFASDGLPGLGLMDIFESKIGLNGEFTKPENLDHPFNSERDDFCFYIDETGKQGFFSSNREKGKGDDDIYSFLIQDPLVCMQYVTGIVRDKNTNLPLPEATVKLLDGNGNVIKQMVSESNGYYKFDGIPCDAKFMVLGEKKDYKSDNGSVIATGVNNEEIKADLNLRPLIIGNKIVINPIYFDFDKSYIRDDAKYELEDIVTVMENNPNMVIKIESHTDSRGSRVYNRKLSDRRAKSTRDYIISRGISPNRIESAIGYGEDMLLNHCDDAHRNTCSEEEHQLNRRSYFIIVSGAPGVEVENTPPTVIDRKPGK
ncbi:MAG: OmpA family protein [Tenacibaculum sp.]|nr:OmpA family protein [Tenacibaculum sp.]